MNYPYVRYIKFLITKRHPYEKIKEMLEEHNLVCPDMTEIDEIRHQLVDACPVSDFRNIIMNKTVKVGSVTKFMTYMEMLKLHQYWLAESNFKTDRSMIPILRTIELFNNNKLRSHLDYFILNNTPYDEIELCFDQRNFILTKAIYDLYKILFFEHEMMTKKDWIALLNKMDHEQCKYYLMAMNEDANKLRYELGYKTKLEYVDALNDVFTVAYYKFKNTSKHDGDEGNHRNARSWAKTLMEAGDRKEKLQVGSTGDFTKALQMEFTFDDEGFPGYSDLKQEKQ